jgi:endonuclease G
MRQWILRALIGTCLVIQGCSTTAGRKPPPDGHPAARQHWKLTPEQRVHADASCYGGLPTENFTDIGPTELVVRRGYVLEHSSADKIPLWVCENVSAEQLAGHLKRRDKFIADPILKGPKSFPQDYKASGYERGHQAPAGNQTVDPVLKDETFFMSNIAPQRPTLNSGIWNMLEQKTRKWAQQYGQAYEWTGPILCNSRPTTVLAQKDTCQRRSIGSGVTVPEYFYKIVLVSDRGTWKAIAFVMPNTDYSRPYKLEPYIQSIEWIEQHTGIEFMPNEQSPEMHKIKSMTSRMWR